MPSFPFNVFRLLQPKKVSAHALCMRGWVGTEGLTQCSGQARILEAFMHRYLRHYHPSWVMQRADITSKEIYKLEAQETILRQLHWRSRRAASQLNEWINWFDDFQCIRKNDVAKELHP